MYHILHFQPCHRTYRSEEHVGCVRRNGCWRRSCIHGVDCRNLVEEESDEVEDD